jgi:hypothetical protein
MISGGKSVVNALLAAGVDHAFMAEAMGKLTRRPALCMGTTAMARALVASDVA